MTSFYVTLVSNDAETAILENGHNTLSSFTNTLADTINFERSSWWFSLHSIYCHNQYNSDDADVLQVRCDLLTPYEGQTDIIATVARPKAKNKLPQHIYYEPDVPEYFQVNRSIISAIKIDIEATCADISSVCSNKLLAGQPTIVVLKFVQLTQMAPLVLRVNSHPSHNAMYRNNRPNSFRASLGGQYNFDPDAGDLEVALSSITYQPSFSLGNKKHLQAFLFDTEDSKKVKQTVTYSDFQGETIDQFIIYLNDVALKDFKTADNQQLLTVDDVIGNDGIRRLQLHCKEKCILQLPYPLMFNMGERGFIPADGIDRDDAVTEYSYKLYLKPGNGNEYDFEAAPDPWAFFPDMAVIYCDFVSEKYLGSVTAPILKSFPITVKDGGRQYITYTVKNEEYCQMSKYDLSSVFFELRDISGNLLPFKNMNSNVLITFLIRQVPRLDINKRSWYY